MAETPDTTVAPRRSFLRALAVLPVGAAALAGPPAGPAPADPIVLLWAESQQLRAVYRDAPMDTPEEDFDPLWDRLKAIDDEVAGLRATNVAEAVASLEWARYEITAFMVDEEPGPGDRLVCALVDGALNVLRRQRQTMA